jgi:hypothetical protein
MRQPVQPATAGRGHETGVPSRADTLSNNRVSQMRSLILAAILTLGTAAPAGAEVGMRIGIAVPTLPQLVRVPGLLVSYAPRLNSN